MEFSFPKNHKFFLKIGGKNYRNVRSVWFRNQELKFQSQSSSLSIITTSTLKWLKKQDLKKFKKQLPAPNEKLQNKFYDLLLSKSCVKSSIVPFFENKEETRLTLENTDEEKKDEQADCFDFISHMLGLTKSKKLELIDICKSDKFFPIGSVIVYWSVDKQGRDFISHWAIQWTDGADKFLLSILGIGESLCFNTNDELIQSYSSTRQSFCKIKSV
jgi:hypothetical protein